MIMLIILRGLFMYSFFQYRPVGSVPRLELGTCQAKFPELLSRADLELAPWTAKGISRAMIDNVWRCDPKDHLRYLDTRFYGLFVSIRNGTVHFAESGNALSRLVLFQNMIQRIASVSRLPDCDLLLLAADHLDQGFGVEHFNGTFDPKNAPILLPFRKQLDSGTVAIPDYAFGSEVPFPNAMPAMDDATALIQEASKNFTWDKRNATLFFMGQAGGSSGTAQAISERIRAWEILREKPGWGKIGLYHSRTAMKKLNIQDPLDEDMIYTRTSLPDHCRYKYLLNLAGNACSTRYKYLFFCNSTVVSPIRSGGDSDARVGNAFEEFYYHRIQSNVHVVAPPTVEELPQVVEKLRHDDIQAQRIANAGTAWAMQELNQEAAWCYWLKVIHIIAKLERKGRALGPRSSNDPLVFEKLSASKHSRRKQCFCQCGQGEESRGSVRGRHRQAVIQSAVAAAAAS